MLENDDNKAVNKEEEALETNNNQEVNEQVDATEAIDEIEKSVAEEAEKEDEKEDDSLPQIDYSKLSIEELVDALKKLLNDNAAHKIKSQVEKIRSSFNKKFGKLLAEKKAQFLEAGGNTIDFKFNSINVCYIFNFITPLAIYNIRMRMKEVKLNPQMHRLKYSSI